MIIPTPINDIPLETITDISQVEKYRGKIIWVELEWNPNLNGYRGIYNRPATSVNGNPLKLGYACVCACKVSGKDYGHALHGISTLDIEKGAVKMRRATLEEVAVITLSYGETL